jgi:hypothetical protein
MGYRDDQIQDAIRSGAIRYGKFDGYNDVTAKRLKKQNRIDARMHTLANMRVNDYGVEEPRVPGEEPMEWPWDTEITPEEVAAAKAAQQNARRQRAQQQQQAAQQQQQPAPNQPAAQPEAQPQQRQPIAAVNHNPTAPIKAPTGVTGPQQSIIRENVAPYGVAAGNKAPFWETRPEVEKFQAWFNKKFGGYLVIDGIWGPKTQGAWDQWVKQTYPEQANESKNKESQVINENAFKALVKQTLTDFLK